MDVMLHGKVGSVVVMEGRMPGKKMSFPISNVAFFFWITNVVYIHGGGWVIFNPCADCFCPVG